MYMLNYRILSSVLDNLVFLSYPAWKTISLAGQECELNWGVFVTLASSSKQPE